MLYFHLLLEMALKSVLFISISIQKQITLDQSFWRGSDITWVHVQMCDLTIKKCWGKASGTPSVTIEYMGVMKIQ